MATTRQTLKQYFRQYATPTEAQFAALIDSFVHKDEDSITQSKIDGLTAALNGKVSTQDLGTAVATAVTEALQNGNIEVTPAAHQHAIADVEDLQAFVTKVNNFLESADVSDETINRWVEIETFLTGITDQETLAGLLLNLKNEILAQIPEPQTGNYLKQISDLDAYTDAQEGEIVQYVGTSTDDYTRGFCYEKTIQKRIGDLMALPTRQYEQLYSFIIDGDEYREVSPPYGDELDFPGLICWNSDYTTLEGNVAKLLNGIECTNLASLPFAIDQQGAKNYNIEVTKTPGYNDLTIRVNGDNLNTTTGAATVINTNTGQVYLSSFKNEESSAIILIPIRMDGTVDCEDAIIKQITGTPTFLFGRPKGSFSPKVLDLIEDTVWQPIATSPVVS